MTAVRTRLGTQEVEQRGDGPPLLWLGSAFAEATWLPVHERLSTTFRVIVPHAPTLRPDGVLGAIDDADDYVLHVLDVLDVLGVERAAVVGTSFGGWMAAELAALGPDAVRALVLVDAMGLYVPGEPAAEIFAAGPGQVARLLLHEPRAVDPAALAILDRSADTLDVMARLIEGQEVMARLGWSPYLHDPRLPARMARYRGPALVVWGACDRVLPEGHAHAWADLLGARLAVVESAGHLPAVERPDEVAGLVESWLREVATA